MKNKVGKGTKVMMDGSRWKGSAVGLYLDSAQHHEIRSAKSTLKRFGYRKGEDVLEHDPRNWWLTELMTAVLFEFGCADGGSSPPFPPFIEKTADPRRGRPVLEGVPPALDH